MRFIGGQLDGSWWSQVGLELNAALAGFGLAYARKDPAQPHLAQGRSGECLRIGARLFPDTTSITRAAATPHQRLPCWSMRCATGVSTAESASGEILKEKF